MIVLLLSAYILLSLIAIGCGERLLFVPHPSSYKDGQDIFKLTAADGVSISAIYLHNPASRYTILYSHGNGEDIGDNFSELQSMRNLGFSVLAYDYHGYGTSQGKPTEASCYLDIEAAYDYLITTKKVPPERIIIHGRSVGGGPSVDLATRKPCAGLILESAFTTAFRTYWIGYLMPVDHFRNIDKIGRVKCPVLVIHGKQDWVVPFRHGQQLFAAVSGLKKCLWVDGAGHNDVGLVGEQAYDQALRDFAAMLEKQAVPVSPR